MLKRKRTKRTPAEAAAKAKAALEQFEKTVKRADMVNAVSTQRIEAYVLRAGPDAIFCDWIALQETYNEVRP